MKHLIVSITLFLASVIASVSASAYSWNNYLNMDNYDIYLVKYGLMSNGVEINSFVPSAKNNNNGEFMSLFTSRLYTTPVMLRGKTADGNVIYRVRIDGDMLYLTGMYPYIMLPIDKDWQPYKGWIKILSVNGDTFKTLDNLGTYRYYQIKPNN